MRSTKVSLETGLKNKDICLRVIPEGRNPNYSRRLGETRCLQVDLSIFTFCTPVYRKVFTLSSTIGRLRELTGKGADNVRLWDAICHDHGYKTGVNRGDPESFKQSCATYY